MYKTIFITFSLFLVNTAMAARPDNCKTLEACANWASDKTGIKYELDKFAKRSLKIEKDFNFKEGNADVIFNYILQSNDFVRLKTEGGPYQIITMRNLKDFKVPMIKAEEIPASFDFYTTEFTLSNKEQVKNAMIMIKKLLSKNGKILEVSDSPKIQVTDSGIYLNSIKLVIVELMK